MNTATSDEVKNLLSIGEAAEYLGISVDTLRRWSKKGRISPYRSPGGHRYYRKEDLDSLFDKKYVRDEPTVRTSKTEDNKVEQEEKNDEKDLSSLQNNSNEDPNQNEAKANISAIPAWRAVELKDEVDKKEYLVKEEITIKEEIVERPIRPVEVPETKPLRVITERSENRPLNSYFEQQKASILSPYTDEQDNRNVSEANSVNYNMSYHDNHVREETGSAKPLNTNIPSGQKIKGSEEKFSFSKLTEEKKYIYIFLSSVTLLLFAIIVYLIFRPEPQPLSPVPY